MTLFLKRLSVVTGLLLGSLMLSSFHASAANGLDHSGEMRLKLERIGQGDAKGEQAESPSDKETELEKNAPDLFKERMREAIRTKQKEQIDARAALEQSLFMKPSEPDTTVMDTEKTLFASDYSVPITAVATQESEQESSGGAVGKTVFTALFGLVFAICGGIYALMRRTL